MDMPPPLVVLIAEDDGPIAAIVAEVVDLLGYTPLVARDGAQALRLSREQLPALAACRRERAEGKYARRSAQDCDSRRNACW